MRRRLRGTPEPLGQKFHEGLEGLPGFLLGAVHEVKMPLHLKKGRLKALTVPNATLLAMANSESTETPIPISTSLKIASVLPISMTGPSSVPVAVSHSSKTLRIPEPFSRRMNNCPASEATAGGLGLHRKEGDLARRIIVPSLVLALFIGLAAAALSRPVR